jgi:hypothetical protein
VEEEKSTVRFYYAIAKNGSESAENILLTGVNLKASWDESYASQYRPQVRRKDGFQE